MNESSSYPNFSIIIPIYNRPDEIDELLYSLTKQTHQNFEVIIVEDGSSVKCKNIVNKYTKDLTINYYYKENTGPGSSRNFGITNANFEYYIFLDSDCIIPETYIEILNFEIWPNQIKCFGGPDASHSSFTPIQKAISYTMTSFLTTGGIRGGSKKVTKFYPRSFNMGFNKEVYTQTKGYAPLRFGEDLDLSMRIEKLGFNPQLIDKAFVYHKRRTDFKKFYKQIFNSGLARINLFKLHPGSLKITHLFPTVFLIGTLLSFSLSYYFPYILIPIFVHHALLFIDASIKNKSAYIGFIALISMYVQMYAYGLGFIQGFFNRVIRNKPIYTKFEENFYK